MRKKKIAQKIKEGIGERGMDKVEKNENIKIITEEMGDR